MVKKIRGLLLKCSKYAHAVLYITAVKLRNFTGVHTFYIIVATFQIRSKTSLSKWERFSYLIDFILNDPLLNLWLLQIKGILWFYVWLYSIHQSSELIEMVSAWSKIVGKKVSFSEDNAGFVVVFILKTYAFIIHNKL